MGNKIEIEGGLGGVGAANRVVQVRRGWRESVLKGQIAFGAISGTR